MLQDIGPQQYPVEVTNSDTADINSGKLCNGLHCGSGGDITVLLADGTSITFAATAAGSMIPVRCKRVMSTGTTPTDIVAFY